MKTAQLDNGLPQSRFPKPSAFNVAAEIRTFVRNLGPGLLLEKYRELRVMTKALGLQETDEALEFARRYFTAGHLCGIAKKLLVDVQELSRCAQVMHACTLTHMYACLHACMHEHVCTHTCLCMCLKYMLMHA